VTAAQRKVATFRLDDDLMNGLQVVYERDGILPSEQVRRAVRTWLESKGVIPAKDRGNAPDKKPKKKLQ
jgi:hypothetical protein